MAVLFILSLLLTVIVPFVLFMIGIIHYNSCPVIPSLPQLLIVIGLLITFSNILNAIDSLTSEEPLGMNHNLKKVLVSTFNIVFNSFVLLSLVILVVWITFHGKPVFKKNALIPSVTKEESDMIPSVTKEESDLIPSVTNDLTTIASETSVKIDRNETRDDSTIESRLTRSGTDLTTIGVVPKTTTSESIKSDLNYCHPLVYTTCLYIVYTVSFLFILTLIMSVIRYVIKQIIAKKEEEDEQEEDDDDKPGMYSTVTMRPLSISSTLPQSPTGENVSLKSRTCHPHT